MAPGGVRQPESGAVGAELAGSPGRTMADAELQRGTHRLRCSCLQREEMMDPSYWQWTLATSRERRANISSRHCRLYSPTRSMRNQSTSCAPTPEGRDEMHLAVRAHRLHKP